MCVSLTKKALECNKEINLLHLKARRQINLFVFESLRRKRERTVLDVKIEIVFSYNDLLYVSLEYFRASPGAKFKDF